MAEYRINDDGMKYKINGIPLVQTTIQSLLSEIMHFPMAQGNQI